MKKKPFVSIIVPTYNRLNELKKCLNALSHLNYPKKSFEVIVIEDGGNDGTEKYMKNFIKKNKNFKYIRQKNAGPARARNLGIRKSKGEIIFFLDDDDLVPKDWIELHLRWYKDKNVAGVGGNHFFKKISWADSYYLARYLDEFLNVQRWNKKDITKGLATANCSYRKKVLDEVGGFDETYPLAAGEDVDLTQRVMALGYDVIKDPSIVTEHLRTETIHSAIKLKFKRMSGAVIDNKRRNIKLDPPLKRLIGQWKNFKKMKRYFFDKRVNLIDFFKFVYMSVGFFLADKYGRHYFSKKMEEEK